MWVRADYARDTTRHGRKGDIMYGTVETGGGVPRDYHDAPRVRVGWTDPRLVRVERLRLLSDPGYPVWDVSYCYGVLDDGRRCRVDLPFSQLPKRRVKSEILYWARRDEVYAKGLGIFDCISTLN